MGESKVERQGGMGGHLTFLSGLEVIFLFGQFISGMWVNLFVNFPSATPRLGLSVMEKMMSVMLAGGGVFMLHMIVGLFLLILSLIVLFSSLLRGGAGVVLASASGLVSVVFAGFNGILFMFSGFTDNLDSYFMAIGFALALASYFAVIYLASKL